MAKKEPTISLIRKFLHILKKDGPLTALKHTSAFLLGYAPDDLTVEYPVSIQLSLNKTCNLHCTFCARQTTKIRDQLASEKNLVMPVDFLNKNLSIFIKAEYVNIAADGEPLLHPEITKIFKLLTAEAQKPNLMFVTNGVLFDEQLVELVVQSQVMEIHFSLDSLTKSIFNFIRPGADLDHMISTGPSIVSEILYKASLKGFKIYETPIVFEDRKTGETKLNFKILLKTLYMIYKFRRIYG